MTPGLSLLELFDADVSGRDFAHGKPDPGIFLTAAAELGSPPHGCFGDRDAVSGIQAAKAGGMAALVIARADDADTLAKAHADLVVTSLEDVDVDRLVDGALHTRTERRFLASCEEPKSPQTNLFTRRASVWVCGGSRRARGPSGSRGPRAPNSSARVMRTISTERQSMRLTRTRLRLRCELAPPTFSTASGCAVSAAA